LRQASKKLLILVVRTAGSAIAALYYRGSYLIDIKINYSSISFLLLFLPWEFLLFVYGCIYH